MKTLWLSLAILLLNAIVGGLATEYAVEFWVSYFRQRPVDVQFLPCAAVGLIAGQFTIPVAAITWLLSFAL